MNLLTSTPSVTRILKVFETFEEPQILNSIERSQDHIFLWLSTNIVELLFGIFLLINLLVVSITYMRKGASSNETKTYIQPIIVTISSVGFIGTIFLAIYWNVCYGLYSFPTFMAYSVTDYYSTSIKIAILFTSALILTWSENYLKNHKIVNLEYPILLSLASFFLIILVSSYNLITMFIAIVGFSLNVYVLLLYDAFNQTSREAGVKYYYLSTFSSGLLLTGILISYILFHTTGFIYIAAILGIWIKNGANETHSVLLQIMLAFIIFGFLFKLAAFPCHLWTPEVYDGSPDTITAFFILPVKIATLAIFIRLLNYVFKDIYTLWNYIVWFASLTSMLWGCFAALVERRIKRFIAFSSINQMGFLLIGIAVGTFESIRASLIYLLIYIIMNIGFFIIYLYAKNTKTNRSLTYLTDFNYLAQKNWLYTSTLVVILFSMAGIPPLAGFFGKYYLFLHAFESKYYALVITGMFTSLISTYYYLRIIKLMWFEAQTNSREFTITLTPTMLIVYSVCESFLIQFVIISSFVYLYANQITAAAKYVLSY